MPTAAFTVAIEATSLALTDAVATKNAAAVATATLSEAEAGGSPVAGKTLTFLVQDKVKGQTVMSTIGTATTDANGKATITVPVKYVSTMKRPIRAVFAGDESFAGSSADASAYRG